MASKSYSVAEARQNLARLIRDAENGRAVEITRRGEPVAVLLSASDYLAFTEARPSFTAAVRAIRQRLEVEQLGIGEEEFGGLRDAGSGREVRL